MSAYERQEYERRRADELYQNMLHSVQVKKKRVADIAMEYMVRKKRKAGKCSPKLLSAWFPALAYD